MEELEAVKLTLHELETTASLPGGNSNIYYSSKLRLFFLNVVVPATFFAVLRYQNTEKCPRAT